jgi:hypothetical protein
MEWNGSSTHQIHHMKKSPSSYLKPRWLKKDNVPEGGSVFVISDFDEIDKSAKTNESDVRLRVTFDERYWFELSGQNLSTAIDLLSDDFGAWIGGRLGLCLASFTTQDGEEKSYIKVVPAAEVEANRPRLRRPLPTDLRKQAEEIPFS